MKVRVEDTAGLKLLFSLQKWLFLFSGKLKNCYLWKKPRSSWDYYIICREKKKVIIIMDDICKKKLI